MASTDRAGDSGFASRRGRPVAGRGAVSGAALLLALAAAACTSGSLLRLEPAVDVGPAAAALQPAPLPGPVPSDPVLVSYPRFEPVLPAPMAESEAECRRDLRRLRVSFREVEPIDQGGACRIDHPVSISAIGSVRIEPAATVTCAMARAFARWTREELVPSARLRYFSGVSTIVQGSSYSCRNIRGSRTASEHSKGNAIDVMRIELNNAREIKVRRPGFFAFRQRSLLNNVRADACGYFSTVLGPGYDRDHKDHFHFDIKERRNGYVACR
jgi:hypothetical protein